MSTRITIRDAAPATGNSLRLNTFAAVNTNPGGQSLPLKLTSASRGVKSAGPGSLPQVFDSSNTASSEFNILNDYPWTLSKTPADRDIPFIDLSEHRNNSSAIIRAISTWVGGTGTAVSQFLQRTTQTEPILQPYEDLYPDNPTGLFYRFPYFNKTHYELNTPEWQKLDTIEGAIGGAMESTASGFAALGKTGVATAITGLAAVGSLAVNAGSFAAKLSYPVVGAVDRPRIFAEHSGRQVTIEFPLLNTNNPDDWIRNKNFCTVFATQNLFAKRNYITGMPPVFYRVYVPGQYFSFASSVTNFSVQNIGNIHLMRDDYGQHIVPDAYQVTITLAELLMPSSNQFQALQTGEARGKVTVNPASNI